VKKVYITIANKKPKSRLETDMKILVFLFMLFFMTSCAETLYYGYLSDCLDLNNRIEIVFYDFFAISSFS